MSVELIPKYLWLLTTGLTPLGWIRVQVSTSNVKVKCTVFWCLIGCRNFIYIIYIYLRILISKHDFHIRWCRCRIPRTWPIPLVQQEHLILPEHSSSSTTFIWVRVDQNVVFYVVFCWPLFVLLSFSFLVIMLSILLLIRLLVTCLISSNFSFV